MLKSKSHPPPGPAVHTKLVTEDKTGVMCMETLNTTARYISKQLQRSAKAARVTLGQGGSTILSKADDFTLSDVNAIAARGVPFPEAGPMPSVGRAREREEQPTHSQPHSPKQ